MNSIVALPILAATPVSSPSIAAGHMAIDAASDPIFAAMERFRVAKKNSDARYARVSKLYKQAAKHGLGDDSSLKERNAFVEAKLGSDPDAYTDETAEAYWAAFDEVLDVSPTTLKGAVAMIRFAQEVAEEDELLATQDVVALLSSLSAAFSRLVA